MLMSVTCHLFSISLIQSPFEIQHFLATFCAMLHWCDSNEKVVNVTYTFQCCMFIEFCCSAVRIIHVFADGAQNIALYQIATTVVAVFS